MRADLRQNVGTFSGYGTTFQVTSNDTVWFGEAVQRGYALGWVDASGSPQVRYVLNRIRTSGACAYEFHCDGALVRASSSLQDAVESFEDHAKIETAYRAKGCVFVHAGAVAWKGRGIVLPARSYAGKTTLVRALLNLGAEYYSDEFAVVDGHGHLRPYTLPLSVRRASAADRVRIAGESAGWRFGAVPVPIDVIAVTAYRRGARWSPRALSPARGLLTLMTNAVAARRPPNETMPILREAVLRARVIESMRGEATRMARDLLAEISDSVAPARSEDIVHAVCRRSLPPDRKNT